MTAAKAYSQTSVLSHSNSQARFAVTSTHIRLCIALTMPLILAAYFSFRRRIRDPKSNGLNGGRQPFQRSFLIFSSEIFFRCNCTT